MTGRLLRQPPDKRRLRLERLYDRLSHVAETGETSFRPYAAECARALRAALDCWYDALGGMLYDWRCASALKTAEHGAYRFFGYYQRAYVTPMQRAQQLLVYASKRVEQAFRLRQRLIYVAGSYDDDRRWPALSRMHALDDSRRQVVLSLQRVPESRLTEQFLAHSQDLRGKLVELKLKATEALCYLAERAVNGARRGHKPNAKAIRHGVIATKTRTDANGLQLPRGAKATATFAGTKAKPYVRRVRTKLPNVLLWGTSAQRVGRRVRAARRPYRPGFWSVMMKGDDDGEGGRRRAKRKELPWWVALFVLCWRLGCGWCRGWGRDFLLI